MAGPNYVAEAFKMKPNLIFLAVGGGAALVLSSAVIFGAVAGLELFYLFSMSSNPRFRRAVRARLP